MSRSEFAEQFIRSLDIFAAVDAVVTRAADTSGALDAAEVLRHLAAQDPETTMFDAELVEAVVQAADFAGVRLSCPTATPLDGAR